ncbi:prephenate dehydrogenase (NADP(+)), partial [Bulinus truncatus]
YLIHLLEKSTQIQSKKSSRERRQAASSVCRRKEYRMLTLSERSRYHDAINRLKNDTSVRPNKYDAIALFHTGTNNRRAHGGPSFLAWHRTYLIMYETALREVDDSVCIPYWYSPLDDQLRRPLQSSIWTPEFLGTPRGPVTSGPFAGWSTPSGVQIIRNVDVDGELFTQSQVNEIRSRNRYEDIMPDSITDIESLHGGVHIYIGGTMSRLDTAAFDPVFFMHHAFIDYLFQMFRDRLRAFGRDPSIPPQILTNSLHAPSAPSGLSNYTQLYGYSNVIESMVIYEPVPNCTASNPSCGDRFLVCQTNRCLPTTRSTRSKRSAPITDTEDTCQNTTDHYLPVQNDYCIGQTCDTDDWVMVPLKVVRVRPPEFQEFKSFPVRGGRVDRRRDIYAPETYNEAGRSTAGNQSRPKTYSRCEKDTSVGQIFVYSTGINYSGRYKESSIVDNRLAVSISVGFVGVKRPTRAQGVTKALIRAHDSCGRVCRIACKEPGTYNYKECSGAVAVSNGRPLMFGNNYDEAVMSVFGYKSRGDYPSFITDNFFITVYCDYPNRFPFAKRRQTVFF